MDYILYYMINMELKNLIMKSYVLSTEKKLQLIDAIEKWLIDDTELEKIKNFLLKNKKEIDNATDKYIENMKKEYNKYLTEKIPELKRDVDMLKLKTNEIITEESTWNPDDILTHIE